VSRAEIVDELDIRILDLLCQDSRRTLGALGERVGLSVSAVQRRIARLEEAGVIRGYTALIDHSKLGRPLEAFVELRFSGSTRVDAIAGIGDDIPEVQDVFTIAGDPDALAWIRVQDVADLKRVVDRLRSSGPVTGTKTLMVLGTSSPAAHKATTRLVGARGRQRIR
jgi:Lrp/AsnC family leucine-responsive transcriptional regulator